MQPPPRRTKHLMILRTAIFAAAAIALLQMGALAQSGKMYRVGLISVGAPENGILGPGMVRDFAAAAAKERAGKIPVVVTNSGDPVATGLAASLAHPGGNLTGISDVASELSAKRLALLKEAAPEVCAVAVPWNADDLGMTLRYRAAEVEAGRLGMQIVPLGVHAPDDFDAAFAAMTEKPPDAILMVTDVLTVLNRKRVIEFAAAHRLPAIYEYAFLAHDEGPMAYGPNVDAIFDRAAGLADQILKGASPADLPLELPTRFDLAINLETAKALGLTIPESILVRADDVIE
jgi:putative tryptophan/tyrosine transport system substrate-binding protein